MRINGDKGHVGIGTTSPGARLEVSDTDGGLRITGTRGAGHTFSFDNSGSDAQNFQLYDRTSNRRLVLFSDTLGYEFSTGGTIKVAIDVNGNVGIGTTTPSQRLHVMGKVTADDYLFNSDLRLKTDVLPLETASEGIACLQGVTYRWSDRAADRPEADDDLQIGLIAQDVERCFPEVVTTAPDGYKSVSYARLVVPLIESAKEQRREIARLKAEQSASRAALAATNIRLARLEALLQARR